MTAIFRRTIGVLGAVTCLLGATGAILALLASPPVWFAVGFQIIIALTGLIALLVIYILSQAYLALAQLVIRFSLLFVGSFALLILIGALLLMLPRATPAEEPIDFLDALFTSTSAVCVTGLIVRDTATEFTGFGQTIILILIQLGGLGIIIFGALLATMLSGSMSVRHASNLGEAVSAVESGPGNVERLVRMHANHREDVAELGAGGIGAIVGGRAGGTGDTLCDPARPLVLDGMVVPEPVLGVTIEPATEADLARLHEALERLAVEDPSFRVGADPDSGAITIAGMGELHLEILVDRLRREFKVDARVGRLQVAYRETITQRGRAEARHAVVGASPAHLGHVVLAVEPAGRGEGYRFENQASSADVPADYVPAVAEGVAEAVGKGVLAGFPMTDLTVALVGGSHHVVDSSPRGFKLAGTRAFRDAATAAAPTVLEPVMELEVRAPDAHIGDVLGDLLARRAKVGGMQARPGVQVISASVPLAEMVGYATALRSSSRGRATYSMQFREYAEVPHATRDRLAARRV